jgi:(2Fe-2S) ferredoxin
MRSYPRLMYKESVYSKPWETIVSYYQKHLFFCTNQREARQCCGNHNALFYKDYAKKRIKMLDLYGPGKMRVSQSGCLGRCKQGPVLVIYPDNVWYTYANVQDIDEIIEQHVLQHKVVDRLLLPQE